MQDVAIFIFALATTAIMINFFLKISTKIHKNAQPIRKDGPQSHIHKKQGTVTMGGLFIMMPITLLYIVLQYHKNTELCAVLFTIISFTALGFCDDYLKVKTGKPDGVTFKYKMLLQLICATTAIALLTHGKQLTTTMAIPFCSNITIDMGVLYIPFAILIIVGSSNAVNITDGLDSLAAILSIITFASLYAISSFHLYHDVASICIAFIGAILGFTWYNAHPAKIFMGDSGSLPIGAVLGLLAIITKTELLLMFTGYIFMIEALSVIIQVGVFKITKKRIFKMAPLHHHFEKLSYNESTISMRFWIIAGCITFISTALYIHQY